MRTSPLLATALLALGSLCARAVDRAGRLYLGFAGRYAFCWVRVEAGLHVFGLPLTVWRQVGYDSDLAHYCIRARSRGIGLRIGEL